MKKYEMLCLLPGTLAEGEVAPIVAQIQEQLTTHGGEDVKTVDLGKSRLAYPVKHIRYGYFEFFTFNILPEKVQTLEKGVRLLGNILRVTIQVNNPKQKATIALAADPTALSAPQKSDDAPRSPRAYERSHEPRKEQKEREEVAPAKSGEEVVAAAEPALNLENIGDKLDEILQKDIDKV